MASLSLITLGVLSVVQALPVTWKYAHVIQGVADVATEYDYIVVGGGTAGTTVADRLSEDGKKSVLLVEYGRLATDDSFMPPWNTPAPEFLYNLTSVPQPNAHNRTFPVANGAVVGGGSAVNGQFFDRGSAHDYDNWARISGFSEWNWKGLYPYFRKSVSFREPSEAMKRWPITYDRAAYGDQTPVYASYPDFQYPGQKIQWQAWSEEPGVEVQKEHADGHAYGMFWIPYSADSHAAYNRSFSGLGHYIKVQPRHNYHLLTLHRVIKINFEKNGILQQAVSVDIQPRFGNQTVFTVTAKKEIIVSAAATRTAVLLQLSGIGPKNVLEAAGIQTLVNLPGVGWNLQDHSFSASLYNFTKDLYPAPGLMSTNATFKAQSYELYKATNSGPYTVFQVNCGLFLPASSFVGEHFDSLVREIAAQKPEQYLPTGLDKTLIAGYAKQKEILLNSFKANDSAILEHLFQGAPRGTAILLKPFSRGSVKINPADPHGDPIFDYRLLSNPIDLKLHVRMQQYLRNHYNTSKTLSQLAPVEIDPGQAYPSDKDVEDWLILKNKLSASNGHSSGTAALMPRELGGVVDGQLRVYGTRGLSVADVSIIPLLVGSHTQSTAYAIGEKAADLIKARNQ